MNVGYLKLYRKLLDWEWYKDQNTKSLFLHCLIKANYSDKTWQGIEVKQGSFITSVSKLSEELGQTNKQIRASLEKLKRTNELAIKTTNKYSIISVINYNSYQTEGQTKGKQKGNNLRIKEVKNREFNKLNSQEGENFCDENHLESQKQSSKFIPPTPEEVQGYCNAHNYSINPNEFVNFYQSKGWFVGKNKMKDWQACLRTWESKRKNEPQNFLKPFKRLSEEEERKQVFQNVLERRKARGEK